MTTTAIQVADIPPIAGAEAAERARTEYARLFDALRALHPADWTRATPCAAWDVRALVGHLVGATEEYASIVRGLAAQVAAQLRALRSGGLMLDEWTAAHVERHAHDTPVQLVARFDEVRERAVHRRMRYPWPLTRITADDGQGHTLTVGHVMTVVATRDSWMHRDDLARATGRPMALDADHDGRIVADVVREWAASHGRPFRLVLTGPAGATYVAGRDGEDLRMDAVAFCRALSGRAPADGLLRTGAPF